MSVPLSKCATLPRRRSHMKKRTAERALTQGRPRYAATMDNLPFGQPFPESQPFPEKGHDVTEPAKLLVRTLLRARVSKPARFSANC
jgi:hypothetical protein